MIRMSLCSLVMLVACGGTQATTVDSSTQPDLVGRWRSTCVDAGGGGSLRLTFDITATTWALDYESFGDAACGTALLVVRIEGPYSITGRSATIAGAHEGRFGFSRKTVTPASDAAVAFLSQACGGGTYAVGVAADISPGCAGLGAYPVGTCPADYDVVARSGDRLQFGNRPADNNMCDADKRPTALSPIMLQRQ